MTATDDTAPDAPTRDEQSSAGATPSSGQDESATGTSAADVARRRRAVLWALVALSVLLAAAAIALGILLRGYAQEQDARQAAVQAARQSALNLTTIDYEDFDAAVARVLEGATGRFSEEYESNSGKLKDLLLENEVKSEGKVIEAGIVRSDRTNATVLVVVDSTVRNTETPEGRVNTNRMQLEVEKVDGRWRTSTLQFVG